jgi:hypothetical protein
MFLFSLKANQSRDISQLNYVLSMQLCKGPFKINWVIQKCTKIKYDQLIFKFIFLLIMSAILMFLSPFIGINKLQSNFTLILNINKENFKNHNENESMQNDALLDIYKGNEKA